jgi:dual-specificity kinase
MTEEKKDWKVDFYKNGIPKEVIVIEDTPPPSESNTPLQITSTSSYRVQQSIPYLLGPPAASTRSKRIRKDSHPLQQSNNLPSITIQTAVKRRKKDFAITQPQGKYSLGR